MNYLLSRSLNVILFMFISIAVLSTQSFGQVSLQAGGGLGYVIPVGDFGGTTIDYYAGSKYGLSNGLNFHAKGRVNIAGLQLAAEIGYTSLSNSGESEPGKGKVDISQKIFSVKLGPEYQFSLPAIPLTPYVGLNLTFNNFSSEVTFNGITKVPSGTFSVKSAGRLGLGISGGAIFKINPLLSLDVGLSYNMMNLIGKKWEDTIPAKDQRLDSYTALNDDKDPIALNANEHFVGSARSVQCIQITASILFGL